MGGNRLGEIQFPRFLDASTTGQEASERQGGTISETIPRRYIDPNTTPLNPSLPTAGLSTRKPANLAIRPNKEAPVMSWYGSHPTRSKAEANVKPWRCKECRYWFRVYGEWHESCFRCGQGKKKLTANEQDYANPTLEQILKAVPMLQWRKCHDCGHVDLYQDNMQPACWCKLCGSADTRGFLAANQALHRTQ